ncbi:MAG: hypothetical protein PF637_01575 [Spirochaetes bacterium]|jgi:hypothetical protein|nr:hypothetical protein [Spirochaetota bacterium]
MKTILISLILLFTINCPAFADDFFKSTYKKCVWSLTPDRINASIDKVISAPAEIVPANKLSDYDNYILKHISSLNFDNSAKPVIYYQESNDYYRDFLFLDNRLSAVSCRYSMMSREIFLQVFNELKSLYGAPETKREELTTTHTFKTDKTTVIFMIRSHKDGFKSRIYFYTNELFRRVLMQ